MTWHTGIMYSTEVKVALLAMDFFVNSICCSSCSEDSRTEKIISIGHSVTEILNVEVRETNNSGNNFLFIFIVFGQVQLPIGRLIIYA